MKSLQENWEIANGIDDGTPTFRCGNGSVHIHLFVIDDATCSRCAGPVSSGQAMHQNVVALVDGGINEGEERIDKGVNGRIVGHADSRTEVGNGEAVVLQLSLVEVSDFAVAVGAVDDVGDAVGLKDAELAGGGLISAVDLAFRRGMLVNDVQILVHGRTRAADSKRLNKSLTFVVVE